MDVPIALLWSVGKFTSYVNGDVGGFQVLKQNSPNQPNYKEH